MTKFLIFTEKVISSEKTFAKLTENYQSPNYRKREDKETKEEEKVQILTLHYSVSDERRTLDALMSPEKAVSTHYVVSEAGKSHQLVDTENAAFAAGISHWDGKENINNISVSVMAVNPGYVEPGAKCKWLNPPTQDRERVVEGSDKTWFTFPEEQVKEIIAVCRPLIEKYNIKPYQVIGNGDATYFRPIGAHVSPGAAYPWKELAKAGVGFWYDLDKTNSREKSFPENPEERIAWMRDKLAEYGYYRPEEGNDRQMRLAMQAFQMHFRQDKVDGNIDLECMQIIHSLCRLRHEYELEHEHEQVPEKIKARL